MAVELRLSKRFLRSLDELGEGESVRVEAALRQLQQQWGLPHVHTGLSVRRLHAAYFECRAGLNLRLVFRATHDGLDMVLAGDHEAVHRLIRGL